MSDPTPTPAAPQREVNQILSGDVKIRKICNSDDEYIITFVGNVSKVLLYHNWSLTSVGLNNDRVVFEVGAKKWVKAAFRKVEIDNVPSGCNGTALFEPVICKNGKKYGNSSIADYAGQKDCKPYVPFRPTCVMELEDYECPIHDKKNEECRHVFVINSAKVNGCGHVVFYVSSKDIDKNNKNKVIEKLKKIPQGDLFHNARFNINGRLEQYWNCTTSPCPEGSTSVSNNVVLALDFFISKADYTKEQAAGIVAGLMGESRTNLDPNSVNPTSGAYGVAQWLGIRLVNLKEFADTKKKPYSEFNIQLEFIALEMKPGNKYTDFSSSYIQLAATHEESLAAMTIYERWEYIVQLYYKNDNSYQKVYDVILSEIKTGTSNDRSLNNRIVYLNTLSKYITSL